MLRQTMTTLAALALASTLAIAQAVQAPVQNPPAGAGAQALNVRIDLTVTEQREGAPLPPRTVSMLVADRESGRVRTGGGNAVLNVDAHPEVTRDGRIRLAFSLEYRRERDADEKAAPALLTESLTMILEDGKPALVSQSADPTAARTSVRVDLKAAILK